MASQTGQRLLVDSPGYRHRYIVLIIVLAAIFMSVLDANVVNVALPGLTKTFGVDLKVSQWVITAYLLANTSLLLIFGRLSEITGKARLFLAGISVFTIGSLACGLATGIGELVLFRVVQGIGSAIVFSITSAILLITFPRRERGKVWGLLGTTVAIGSIAGPVLGGLIIDTLGWPYIFFINVPVGIALVAAAMKYLKLAEAPKGSFRMDWIGAGSIVLTVTALILLVNSLADLRGPTLETGLELALFSLALATFIVAELKHENPILDLSVFKTKTFTFASLSSLINFTWFASFGLVMPFFLEIAMGYSPSVVGTALLVQPAIMAVMAPFSGWLYDRLQSTYHSSLGMLIMAASMFGLSFALPSRDIRLILALVGVFAVGSGLFTSPNSSELLGSLLLSKSTTASGVQATARNLGNSIGVALASIVLYAQLRALGFAGQVIDAKPGPMIQATGTVLMVGGALCLAGMGTSLLIGYCKKRSGEGSLDT